MEWIYLSLPKAPVIAFLGIMAAASLTGALVILARRYREGPGHD